MPGNSGTAKAGIFGCASLRLSDEERRFFSAADPLGFILFSRNIDSPEQLKGLVADLRDCVERPAPVLIDQEGGRVQRLRPPHWRKRPPMASFGRMAASDPDRARRAARLDARLIAADLSALGISADCAPLLDVPVPGADDIIGDRAFGPDPALVTDLGWQVLDGLLDGGVIPVIKHIPGHGRALVDSHLELPVVDADLETLRDSDFIPFRSLAGAPWAMTAHVVYKAIDPLSPATVSPLVIEQVIRREIGCESLLLSDDLSMKALKGDFAERARAAVDAGCDVALHCNGDMNEMKAVASGLRPLSDAALERLARGEAMLRDEPVMAGAEDMLDGWLAGSKP